MAIRNAIYQGLVNSGRTTEAEVLHWFRENINENETIKFSIKANGRTILKEEYGAKDFVDYFTQWRLQNG